MPVLMLGFQMQGKPPEHWVLSEHMGKQAPPSRTDTGTHAPVPHSAPVGQSVEQIPDAPSALGVNRKQTRLRQS
jgi:hypothetical protein